MIPNKATAIRRAPSAGAANDNTPQPRIAPENLIARAIAIFAAISLLASILLMMEMLLAAQLFGAPEFAQHPGMEFLMAGILGAGAAGWFLIKAFRGRDMR